MLNIFKNGITPLRKNLCTYMMLLHASEKNLYNRMAMNLIFFLNNFELQDDVLKTLVKIYHVTGLCEVGRNIHSVEMAKALSWPDSYSCNQVKY